MAVHRKEGDFEQPYISFTLTPNDHAWLQEIQINRDGEAPIVSFCFKEEAAQREAVERAQEKLQGLKILFEPEVFRMPSDQYEFMRKIDEQLEGGVDFDAGPTSKIRDILQQADIPRDLQAAVMQELQQVWKTRG